MKVVINGKSKEIPQDISVKALLEEMGLGRDGVAVAVNRKVVPKSKHLTTGIPDGATIEVIRAVGGG
ncbi:MAG: sulfur carrier protein ThiS [Proteobacteria bacterium]|jgi:sulfur carrier protein|nr:sulfur carrier protein ThiS [Pseudomonadota bacterium]